MMKSLCEIAEMVSGKIFGDPEKQISGVASFDDAGDDQIAYAVKPGLLKSIGTCRAGAVVVPKGTPCTSGINLVLVENPELAFARIIESFLLRKKKDRTEISTDAIIGKNFSCGERVTLSPFCFVGDDVFIGNDTVIHPHVVIGSGVTIGKGCIIYPQVTIYDRCLLGNQVIIHAGTVIGSDGFGFVPDGPVYRKIHHIGMVQIDDEVEIGANNTIDRAKFGRTWIKRGVKTDNLVHIAHNVVVGENTILIAQVGISGSVTIGKNVIMAGQAGVGGHLTIGDHAVIGPKTGVPFSVEKGSVLSGFYAMPHKIWLRVQRTLPFIPEFQKRLSRLEKKVFRDENE